MSTRVIFFAPPTVTPLDLIGPLQAFQLGGGICHHPYDIVVCGLTSSVPVAGNLHFSNLVPYREIKIDRDDILFIAGCTPEVLHSAEFLRKNRALFKWIRQGWESGATICSICTGSYLLAEAGVLDGKACATHWLDVDELQRRYPKIEVKRGILFVQAGNVFTSAGIASGIDMAIHLIGLRHGPKVAFEMARFLVVYLRRSGDFEQESVYLKFRNHLDDVVHRAQNILIEKLDRPPGLERLAAQVGASARNLSRRFRQSLQLSVGGYLQELRLEHARALLREEGSKVEDVAHACGFSGSRQLRNLYQARFGRSPRDRKRRLLSGA
ncbi:MAG TPA: helix-turn-helix domain-containing protein [Lacunisphaera sp.]|jgi:transcriptional regulator GlxA family with amidase domain